MRSLPLLASIATLVRAVTSLVARAAAERPDRRSARSASLPRFTLTELATPGGATMIRPKALNDHGQVIGEWLHGAGTRAQQHGFFWDRGQLKSLGPMEARDLNNEGQVVGRRIGREKDADHPAALWRKGRLTLLDLFPESVESSTGYSINDRGQVIGIGSTDQPSSMRECGRRVG